MRFPGVPHLRLGPKPPPLRLHLGAHKTATTYLQALLALNRDALAAQGAVYLGPELLRGVGAGAVRFQDGGVPGKLLRRPRAARALARLIAAEAPAGGASRAIVSEENLLGSCGRIMRSGRLYTGIDRMLGAFGRMVDGPETVALFAIRGYADFFASAHSQLARHKRPAPLDPIPRDALLSLRRRWPQVARDLRRIMPRSRLIVWRYEDFRALEAAVIEALTGLDPATLRRPSGHRHPSLSANALEAVMAEEATRGAALSPGEVRALGEKTPGPRYDPWTAEERARFAAAYAEDWEAIRATPGVEPLSV
ncbi:MAG: hypothetical protein AAGF90_01705 [Pseudomonadota bacterium]